MHRTTLPCHFRWFPSSIFHPNALLIPIAPELCPGMDKTLRGSASKKSFFAALLNITCAIWYEETKKASHRPMGVSIEVKKTDDPAFITLVETLINRLDAYYGSDEVYVIRIRGWFDHKWLGFSGIGRVPFDSPFPGHPQVALDEFSQDQTTFPPFTPKRVLAQESWILTGQNKRTRLPHEYRYAPSAKNLHRRIKDHSESALYMWYSSETEQNQRGSVMIYNCRDSVITSWYSSFVFRDSWQVDKTKGVSRKFVADVTYNTDPQNQVNP